MFTTDQKYVFQKVTRMPATRPGRVINSRFVQLRSQLEKLEIGEIGRIWSETKEEANSIRSDVYKLIRELGWAENSSSHPSQKTAICEENNGWALYVTRFG